MNNLPAIGSEVVIGFCNINNLRLPIAPAKVKVIHHHDDKSFVFSFENNSVFGCNAGVALITDILEYSAEEPTKDEPSTICRVGEHHYVQMHEAHSLKAFCTCCGHIISLE